MSDSQEDPTTEIAAHDVPFNETKSPDRHRIRIVVEGPPESGKGTIMAILARALSQYDTEVTQRPPIGKSVVCGRLTEHMAAIAPMLEIEVTQKTMFLGEIEVEDEHWDGEG